MARLTCVDKVLPGELAMAYGPGVIGINRIEKPVKKLLLMTVVLGAAMAVSAADVPEEGELKLLTEDSIGSFGQAVRDKDFSAFYKEISALWQKQITAEKLKEAFRDFFDKDIDLPAA